MDEKNHSHRRSPIIIIPPHYTEISGKVTSSTRDKIEIESIVKTRVQNLIMEINDIFESINNFTIYLLLLFKTGSIFHLYYSIKSYS